MPATNFTTFTKFTMKPNVTDTTLALCKLPANEVFIFAYSLLFLVSLVLNCITMRVYFCSNQNVQSSVTVYMKNLVAADFFLCLCLPLRIAAYANNSEMMSNIYCSFGATAFYINMYASILFMDFIAANRYAPNACKLFIFSPDINILSAQIRPTSGTCGMMIWPICSME